jgi:hypothetical protein
MGNEIGCAVGLSFLIFFPLGMWFMGAIAARIYPKFWRLYWLNMMQPPGKWKRRLPSK